MNARASDQNGGTPAGVFVYIASLAALAVGVAIWSRDAVSANRVVWAVLPLVGVVLVASESLFVRYRYGGETNALNLMEAPLPVLLYGFPLPAAMVTVAIAQLGGALVRRNQPVKAAFNIAQWTLGVGLGGMVYAAVAGGAKGTGADVGAAFLAVMTVALYNQMAFSAVVALAGRRSLGRVFAGLSPVMVPGWLFGGLINAAVGLLFLLAYLAHPLAVLLFPVPLAMLHFAYRSYAGVRSDRLRLDGLLRAADVLVRSLDPTDEIRAFLDEVTACFQGRGAVLILRAHDRLRVYSLDTRAGRYDESVQDTPGELAAALLARTTAGRARAGDEDALGQALGGAGMRDCIFAPLTDRDHASGVLAVVDQAGLEGFEDGEVAVLDALAMHAAALLGKGRLMHAMLDERTKLAEIVANISDGLMTIDRSGIVRSWNPAMERLTGVTASEMVGRPEGLDALGCADLAGRAVRFSSWADQTPARELLVVHRDGITRRFAGSYGIAVGSDGSSRTLIAVMRDMTPHHELRELRQEASRLAAAEAAQRAVVEQLQEMMTPPKPSIPGMDIGVFYVASDPASPTGGDLYDVQQLADGTVHVAVVDVVGHGVAATKDALSVIHILRMLAIEGCALEHLVARADSILGQLDPELAATVLVVRYEPETGTAQLVGGGHPPALLVRADGSVEPVPAPGGALGWPEAGSTAISSVILDRGDRLFLYTDGLIEARRDIVEGERALIRHAASLASEPAQAFAEFIVRETLPDEIRPDDSLAFILQRTAAAETSSWTIDPTPDAASALRRTLATWAAQRMRSRDAAKDLALVASELITNAIAVARSRVTVTASIEGQRVTLDVADDGPGDPDLAQRGIEPPTGLTDAGRGLFLVRALCDDLTIESGSTGTLVRCVGSFMREQGNGPARHEARAVR